MFCFSFPAFLCICWARGLWQYPFVPRGRHWALFLFYFLCTAYQSWPCAHGGAPRRGSLRFERTFLGGVGKAGTGVARRGAPGPLGRLSEHTAERICLPRWAAASRRWKRGEGVLGFSLSVSVPPPLCVVFVVLLRSFICCYFCDVLLPCLPSLPFVSGFWGTGSAQFSPFPVLFGRKGGWQRCGDGFFLYRWVNKKT